MGSPQKIRHLPKITLVVLVVDRAGLIDLPDGERCGYQQEGEHGDAAGSEPSEVPSLPGRREQGDRPYVQRAQRSSLEARLRERWPRRWREPDREAPRLTLVEATSERRLPGIMGFASERLHSSSSRVTAASGGLS